ncbi:trypsin-like peptidase domain-containing protein [Altericista sp. CCNU0014]|uniref:trypsin-like peptidase domain-containing protein n=1 Tax=Altericista sp. CCNU0014 TaxID=3082949 RepID=UPI00384A9123
MMPWNLPAVFAGVSVAVAVASVAPAAAPSSAAVNQVARSITVRIVGNGGSGSGALVRKEGKTYTLLTAAHVLSNPNAAYEAIAPDGQRYALDRKSIKTHDRADLAIAQFASAQSYAVAKIGSSEGVAEGAPIYVAGFPAKTAAMTESIYNFTKGEITAAPAQPFKDGYGLVYTNTTLPGMSGGPILNEDGALIGIHGRADAKAELQDQQLNPQIYVKSGVNLGIPVGSLFSLIPKEKLTLAAASSAVNSTVISAEDRTLIKDLMMQSNFKLRQNDLGGAIAALDQVVRLDPNNIEAFNERGSLYLMKRDFLAAVTDFRQTVQIDPNFAGGYYNQGIAYLRSGSPREAQANFKKAAELFKALGNTQMYKKTMQQLKGF